MNQTIALAGNPNAGKTSLFNNLTGTRQYVGNWAGVTVEKKEGWIKELPGATLVDLPGVYSLSAQSIEEKLAISYLLKESPSLLVNIVDASNLERNLYFSLQLLEMGLPALIALNMMDVADARGMKIDLQKLSERLGAPIVPMVARKGKGHRELIERLRQDVSRTELHIPYPAELEAAVDGMIHLLKGSELEGKASLRWLALQWLERNEIVESNVRAVLAPHRLAEMERLRQDLGAGAEQQLRRARYTWIEELLGDVVTQGGTMQRTWSDRIDGLLLHKYLGLPVFFAMMYLVFQITYTWVGSALSDVLDGWFSGPLTDGLGRLLAAMNSPEWFTHLMTDGILAGVGGVLVFVPQIGILFLCLTFLEDSGYMARAAVLMDRAMSAIGLNGKAFIPLILGFGCNVPAIMATRTLEDHKGRLMTSLIAPFMSCSARLTVYSLFVSAFFEAHQAEVVFLLYVTGIVMAIGTAFLLKKVIPADEGLFLMELPPYRAPMMKSLWLHTWDKAKGFIRKAGTIIFGMSVLLWFLGHFSFGGYVPMEQSFLKMIGQGIAPLFAPLHFATWQAGVSLLTGFLAKEVVVSTMSIVYGAGANGATLGTLLHGTFDTAAALGFLFFVLLYTPCISTVVMMKRETGSWKWTISSIVYSFAVAWVVALVVYYVARVFV